MTPARDDNPSDVRTADGGFRSWFRAGGWVLCAAGLAVAAVISTIELPPSYDALSRPQVSTDALPTSSLSEAWVGELAAGSSRLLGTDGDSAYYLAAPAGVSSGLCFIAADLVDPGLSQVGCSSPGTGAGFQFADVTLSDHRPADGWVEIAEDVWRDTHYQELP